MLVKHIQPRDSRENQTLLMLCGCLGWQEAKSIQIFLVFAVKSVRRQPARKCRMPPPKRCWMAHIALFWREVGISYYSVSLFAKSRLSLSGHSSAVFVNVKATLPLWDGTKILQISFIFRRIEKSNQNFEIVMPNLKFSSFFPPLLHPWCTYHILKIEALFFQIVFLIKNNSNICSHQRGFFSAADFARLSLPSPSPCRGNR